MFPIAPGCPVGMDEGTVCLAAPTPVVALADLLSGGIVRDSWELGPSGGVSWRWAQARCDVGAV